MKIIMLLLLVTISTYGMDKTNFKNLLKQVKESSFEDGKITIIKTSASSNTFKVKQISKLMKEFSFSSGKLKLIKIVSGKIEDPRNRYNLIDNFSFDSDKDKARALLANIKKAKKIKSIKMRKALIVNQLGVFSKRDFNYLEKSLKKESFADGKIKRLKDFLNSRNEGFTASQLTRLIKTFSFGSDMVKMIKLIDSRILGMTSNEMLSLLKTFSFSGEKLKALKTLKDTITDAENKVVILSAFTFDSDKEKARKILATIKPRSLVYGRLRTNRVVFVVDISGSMQARFVTNRDESVTRLTFVVEQLKEVLNTQMDSSIDFNIIVFNERVRSWKHKLVRGNNKNIREAIRFLNSLVADGGTNIYDSLRVATKLRDIETIYFLTDGMPTAGLKTKVKDIITDLKKWSNGVVVNATAFLIGSHSSDNERKSIHLMRSIAAATGGVYRAIDD